MEELKVSVARLEQQNKEQDRRIKNLEHSTEALSELTFITRDLVDAVKNMTEVQKAHSERLELLERAPGDKLVSIKNTFVIAIVSAIAGGIATAFIQAI